MIDLICPQCQTKLPVAENKLGTRIFICPHCAHPLDAPTPPREPVPAPALGTASEDKTMAPDESQLYVQEKLRQIAEKRKAKPESAAPEKPKQKKLPPPAKNQGLPKALLWGGAGLTVAGLLVVAGVAFVLLRGPATPQPAEPGVVRREPEKKRIEQPEAKHAEKTVAELSQAVRQGPASARQQALHELKARGPEAHAALPAVLDVLKDSDAEQRKLAQAVLANLGPATKTDVPVYAAALRAASPDLRIYAVERLAELGPDAKSELVYLRVLSLDDDPRVQEAAQKAVQRMQEEVMVSAAQRLQDKSPLVRSKAAQELADMGAQAKAALPSLIEALADDNSAVRLVVLSALVAIGPDAVVVLGEALRDKKPQVRLSAINALGRIGPDARFVLPDLIAVIASAEAKEREETYRALSRLGEYAIPYLMQALESTKDAAKQKPLLVALERLGPSAAPALQKALQAAKPEVKKAAAPAVAKVASRPALPPRKVHTGITGLMQSQLIGWFNASDGNKDDFLDKTELARAIRGAKAKPYDEPAAGKPARAFGPSDFARYPDYAFLCRLDRDNDGKISRDEYERWAYDFAEFQKKDKDDRDRMMQAQNRLREQGISEALRMQREAGIRQMWAAYNDRRTAQNVLSHDLYQMQWLQRWTMNHVPKR